MIGNIFGIQNFGINLRPWGEIEILKLLLVTEDIRGTAWDQSLGHLIGNDGRVVDWTNGRYLGLSDTNQTWEKPWYSTSVLLSLSLVLSLFLFSVSNWLCLRACATRVEHNSDTRTMLASKAFHPRTCRFFGGPSTGAVFASQTLEQRHPTRHVYTASLNSLPQIHVFHSCPPYLQTTVTALSHIHNQISLLSGPFQLDSHILANPP